MDWGNGWMGKPLHTFTVVQVDPHICAQVFPYPVCPCFTRDGVNQGELQDPRPRQVSPSEEAFVIFVMHGQCQGNTGPLTCICSLVYPWHRHSQELGTQQWAGTGHLECHQPSCGFSSPSVSDPSRPDTNVIAVAARARLGGSFPFVMLNS